MDQGQYFSQSFLARLSKGSLNIEPNQTTAIRGSPFLNGKQQIPGTSSSHRQEPQGALEPEDHAKDPQGHHVHDTNRVPVEVVIHTQRDPEGLQACLKPPDIAYDAQPASGAHSGGVEHTTTSNTTAARNPFKPPGISKPSLLQSQPAQTATPQPKANDSINKDSETKETTSTPGQPGQPGQPGKPGASAPPRKLLPGTSKILRIQSAKENNALLPRPILNNTKKTYLPSSTCSSIKVPKRSLFAPPKKAYQQNKFSRPSPSSRTPASRSKQSIRLDASKLYFKGNGSYYTPLDPASLGVSNHPSNPAMDNTRSTGIKIRLASGKDNLKSSSQLSRPVLEVPVLPSMVSRQETQPTHSGSHEYASHWDQPRNQQKGTEPEPLSLAQQTVEDDTSSRDSELSDVKSVDSRSFGSNDTASAPGQSPILVIADSDDEDDEDDDRIIYDSGKDDNDNDDDDQILYGSAKDDNGRIVLSAKKDDFGRNDNAHAEKPDNNTSATGKPGLYTKHTKGSALDDAAYKYCKDQFGNIIKTEGALVPVGYQLFDGDFPWHGHRGSCFNDNLDGTLTFLGLYTKQTSKQPPIIVSKKAMSLGDSPMLEPLHTVANHYKYRAGFPEKLLNEHVPRREGQTKEVASIQATIAVRGPPLPKPDKILTMAEPDRPYNMWLDPIGKLEQLHGGLIPSEWTPYYEYPTRQWICPIRSCQCLTKNRYHFGRHWLTHRGCHLNDNLDGTFTILRSPSQAQLDDKEYTNTPSVVVAREPLDNEPIRPPQIRIKDPSGTQPIWVSLSSYLESIKRGRAKDVKATTHTAVPTKIRILQSGPKETPFKPLTEAHFDEELIMATNDRKYSVWWDPDHGLKDTRGALIPEGYELDETWPGRPWVCPIRSCRVVCKNIWSLGWHFSKLHASASLNDNRDGTFSILGTHQLGAPRVVSKRRVSLHKDPTVETCLPSLKKAEIEEEERKRRQMGASMVKPTTHKPAADPEGLWKYICSMIDDDLARPTHPSFDHLLALPRIRDLNIIDKRLNPKHLIHSTLTVGLVIQVTGVERQTKQCTACRRGDGPFQECVSICPELANEVAQSNPSLVTSPSNRWCCMNCVVNKKTSQCSLKASMLERSEDGSVKESIPHWMVDSEQRPPAGMAKKPKEASQDTVSVDGKTNSSYRRSGRLRLQFETKPSSESQKRSFDSTDMAFSQLAAAAPQEEEASSSLRASKRVRGMQSPADLTPNAIQESLMVEDWEREAKVIPKGNGSSDNLAFSSSYNRSSSHQNSSASTTQTIPSFPSLSTQVIRIPSGSSHYLGVTTSNESQHQNRMCTVISGKLRVKVQAVDDETDNAEFNIGFLGVFKLAVGMEAKVENWGYDDAVLQVVGTY